MNNTRIEWCDYTVNPVRGLCPVACPYCYARKLYKRFHWDEEIRLDTDSFLPLLTTIKRKPSRVFVGSTMELFGPWVKPEWMDFIMKRVTWLPEHTFLFLTKRPQELAKYNWPDNCWVGASATNAEMFKNACTNLHHVEAKVRFVSVEPLLSWDWHDDKTTDLSPPGTPMDYMDDTLDWVIIGQQTPVRKPIPREWVEDITSAADKAHIPVFHKDSLKGVVPNLRQEWPR